MKAFKQDKKESLLFFFILVTWPLFLYLLACLIHRGQYELLLRQVLLPAYVGAMLGGGLGVLISPLFPKEHYIVIAIPLGIVSSMFGALFGYLLIIVDDLL